MTRIIIVDDEELARLSLRTLLERYVGEELRVIAEATNLLDAVQYIRRFQPDVVFLDVDMPGETGLELFHYFTEADLTFEVVFATAYSDYAVQAFELAASDYLLKPISMENLQRVMGKIHKKRNKINPPSSMVVREQAKLAELHKIAVNTGDGITMLQLKDVVYLKADGAYVYVYLRDGSRLMLTKRLADFEKLELTNDFLRLHRSYIVNMRFIQKITKMDEVVLETGEVISISEEKRKKLNEWINGHRL